MVTASWHESAPCLLLILFPHLWISPLWVHMSRFVSVILSYPLNTRPWGKVWETHVCEVWSRCDTLRLLVSLAWVMSTRHASWVGCWVSCLQECLLLRIFRHQCAYEFPFPLLSVLTVIRRNWTKRLTHVNWSSCGCWESVELREKEKRRKKKEMNRIKVADESQLEEKKL